MDGGKAPRAASHPGGRLPRIQDAAIDLRDTGRTEDSLHHRKDLGGWPDRGRAAGPLHRPARGHRRAAADRAGGLSLPIHPRGLDARLRPRCAHGDPAGRGEDVFGDARQAARQREAAVPARGGDHRRRAADGEGGRAGESPRGRVLRPACAAVPAAGHGGDPPRRTQRCLRRD